MRCACFLFHAPAVACTTASQGSPHDAASGAARETSHGRHRTRHTDRGGRRSTCQHNRLELPSDLVSKRKVDKKHRAHLFMATSNQATETGECIQKSLLNIRSGHTWSTAVMHGLDCTSSLTAGRGVFRGETNLIHVSHNCAARNCRKRLNSREAIMMPAVRQTTSSGRNGKAS